MTTKKIDPHALAALALAAHVRNIALEDRIEAENSAQSDDDLRKDRTHPDNLGLADGDHDQWLDWYECALDWASLDPEPNETLHRQVHVIVKNLMGGRLAPKRRR